MSGSVITIGGVNANALRVTQTDHGFELGQPLYRTIGAFALAQADSAEHAEMVGVVGTVVDEDTFLLNLPYSIIQGLSVTDGTVYFLSPTVAGGVTSIEPDAHSVWSKPVYVAISNTSAVIYGMRGIELLEGTNVPIWTVGKVDPQTLHTPSNGELWINTN